MKWTSKKLTLYGVYTVVGPVDTLIQELVNSNQINKRVVKEQKRMWGCILSKILKYS